jgi:hypothetical protein
MWEMKKYYGRKFILEQLEDRIVLDAAGGNLAQDNPDNPDHKDDQIQDQGQNQVESVGDVGPNTPAESTAPDPNDPVMNIFDQNLSEVLITNVVDDIEQLSEGSTVESQDGFQVVLISSGVEDAQGLAAAAKDGVITIIYDADNDSPELLLETIAQELNGQKASSIALATHDVGDNTFYLPGGSAVTLESVSSDESVRGFWSGLGDLLEDDGRIDLMSCTTAQGEEGLQLLHDLESLTGRNVAASDDPTGNAEYGGDWILETDDVDLTETYFAPELLSQFEGRLAAIDMNGLSGWKTIMSGSKFDPVYDQQAQKASTDLTGDDDHGVLYTAYDDKGTATESDDEIAFRIRMGGADSGGSFSAVLLMGIDADLDGDLDMFITVQDEENGIRLWHPGSELNVSPNTTSTAPAGYEFSLEGNYSFVEVTETNDPDWGLGVSGYPENDIGNRDGADNFLTFKLPFYAIRDVLAEATSNPDNPDPAIYITKDSPLQYILGTSTQDNAFNSDLGGVGKEGIGSKLTWEELGAFSPVVSASNIFPEITNNDSEPTNSETVTTGHDTTVAVIDMDATDQDNDMLSFSITGGADQNAFTIDPVSGKLYFKQSPSYTSPADSDADNDYLVQVTVSDGKGGYDVQDLTITVSNSDDTTGPVLTNLFPADEETAVQANSNIVFTFNEDIQLVSGTTGVITITEYKNPSPLIHTFRLDGTSAEGDVSIVGNTLILNPTTENFFNASRSYRVELPAGAIEDLEGNDFDGLAIDAVAPHPPLSDSSDSTHNTGYYFTDGGLGTDTTPPAFVSSPQDYENTGNPTIAVGENIELVFDKAVFPEDVAGNGDYFTIRRDSDGSAVAVISVSDSSQVIFGSLDGDPTTGDTSVFLDPTQDLEPGTKYYVEIGGGAVESAGGYAFAGWTGAGTDPDRVILQTEDPTPSVLNVTSYNPDGTWIEGDRVFVVVQYDNPVYVTGTPKLQLETGATDQWISYTSGSGTNELVFTYDVKPQDNNDDLDYFSNTALILNGGTITSSTGKVASLTLPDPGDPKSLGDNKDLLIDASPINTVPDDIPSIAEEGTFVFNDPDGVGPLDYRIQISDVDYDPADLLQVTLSVDNGSLLITNSVAGITVTDNNSSTVTIEGNDIADLNAVLADLQYTPDTDYSGTDTLRVVTWDGKTSYNLAKAQDTDTVSITVTPVSDSDPLAKDDTFSGTEDTEVKGNVLVDNGGGADDKGDLGDGWSMAVTNAPLNGTVWLSWSTGEFIYTPDQDYYGSDQFEYTITDSDGQTSTATVTLDVAAVNDAPVNALPTGPLFVALNTTTAITGVSVNDVEATAEDGDIKVTLTLPAGVGTLDLDTVVGVTMTGDLTNSVELTGKVALVNAALATLQYIPGTDYTGSPTLEITTNDLGNTPAPAKETTSTLVLEVNTPNDAPTVTVPGTQTTDEGEWKEITGIQVADTDAGDHEIEVTLSVGSGNGTLKVKPDVVGGVDGFTSGKIVYNAAQDQVTLTGTLAEINATLGFANTDPTYLSPLQYGLYYQAPDNPTLGAPGYTLTITANDLGNTGTGGALSGVGTVSIQIGAALNDAPVNILPAGPLTATYNTATVVKDAGGQYLQISDVDAGTGDLTVTLTVSNGTLDVTPYGGLVADDISGNGTGNVVVTGTIAEINATLGAADGLTYTGTVYGTDTLIIETNDNGNTGSPGPLKDVDYLTISVPDAVNDPPVNRVPGTQTIDEDVQTPITGISISDPDVAAGDEVTVKLSVTNGTLFVKPDVTGGVDGSIAGKIVYSAGNDEVTLTGTISQINTTLAYATGLQYTSDLNYNGDDTLTVLTNDQGHNPSGIKTDTDTVPIIVAPVNDAPVLSNLGGTLVFTEGDAAKVIDADITISDASNENDVISTATIRISDEYQSSEDILSIAAGDLVAGVEAEWDAATGTLVLTGPTTRANYELMLEKVTYLNTSTEPSTADRTVTWTVNDGTHDSVAQTSTIKVIPTSDPPVISDVGQTLAYTEGDGAKVIDSDITITDPDDTNIESATIVISGGYVNGQDVLTEGTLLNGVTASWSAATGTLTLTGPATKAQYETMLESITYTNSSDDPNTVNRTVTWTVNDGDVNSDPKTSTITVTPTNDPPVLSDVAPTMAYTEGDGAKVIDSALTITDVDDTNIESATIVISGGYVNGQDVLTEGTLLNGVTASWSAATGTLTLTGPATKADYETMLESITYSNSSDDPNTANRTITWTVNDGDDNSASQNTTITVTPTNDPPVLSDVAPTLAYTEGDGAKVIDSALTITDVDDTNIESATIVISGGYVNGQDVLTEGTLLNGVTASWSAATGTLTLTGPATKADYETMLESITYSNSSDDPNTANRTITWTVNDGDDNSASQNTTITVTPTNDPPVLSDVAPTMAYTEGDGAKVIDSALTITDVDDTNIESATIVISAGYVNGQDVLTEGTLLNGVTASWSAATGTLTLTGPATKADYETMLEQITYSNSSDDPNTANRTITWTVNDGDANSAQQNTTISVTPTNDPPVLSDVAPTMAYTEGDGAKVIDPDLTISDLDDTNIESATIVISAGYVNGQDVLTEGTLLNGVTASWSAATGTLTLTGPATKADYETMLEQITYSNSSDDPSTANRTITWTVNDGDADSTPKDTTISVTPTNDPPVLADVAPTLAYTEGDGAKVIDPDVTITDLDDTNIESATIVISGGYVNGQDVLTEGTLLNGVTASWSAATGTLTLTGPATKADYETMLEQITYSNSSDDPSTANRTITWTVNDGDADSAPKDTTITVTPTNDPPVLSDVAPTLAYTEGDGAKVIDPDVTITDLDDTNIESATIVISAGYVNGQDVLTEGTLLNGVTASWSAATGTLTLTGPATKADYETMLEQITYSNSSDDPNTANRTITWTVNDGDADSTPKDTTITVTPTNDPPVLSDVAPTLAYTEGDGAKVIDADLTITDLDDTNIESATIVISAGYINGQDVLTEGTLLNGVTASWSAATGTLTLTGPATKADYETMLEQITYSNSSDDPNTANRTITWTVNDGDADSAPKDTTISVTPTNDPPVLADVAPTLAYTEGDGAKVIDLDVTITDLDDTNIESATIVISGGYVNGQDVLTQGTLLNGVTASWSAATGTLTLTGPATKADYETMLEQITYSNSSDDPNTANRTITWTVNDGDANSAQQNTTISVTPTNDPPVLSDVAPTTSYTEGDGAKVIDSALTITDLDDTNIESATIVISGGYVNGQDVLTQGTLLNGVTASWSAATGTLTLNGPATKADYETMLEQITYSNSSDDPNTANRTITWTVNDGDAESTPKDTTITVTPTNDPPVLSDVAPTMAYTEGNGAKVIDPALTITDLDDTNIESATIVISGGYVDGQDVLTEGTLLNGVTASWSAATGTLTLTGPATKADYETMLEQITYSNSSDDPNTANRTITWTVNDGFADSAPKNTTISVTPTNDPPVLSDVAPTLAYTEGDGAKVIDPALTITDLDDTNIESATIVISGGYVNGQDVLTEGTLLNGVTASWSAATGTLTLTGPATKADYETMLEQITYSNSSDDPNTANRTITWTVNDGDANSAQQNTTISVTPTNDPPVLSDVAPTTAYTEGDGAKVIDSALTITDLDDTNIESATIVISAGYVNGQDVLTEGTLLNGVTASWSAATGILTLTGPATKADYETMLESITYSNSSDDPNTANRTITWTVNDGDDNSASQNTTITVTPTNDPPVLSDVAPTMTYTEGDGAKVIDPDVTITDLDDTNIESATIVISGGYVNGQDVLTEGTLLNGVTASWSAATGTLTLTGPATKADYETMLESITYSNSSDDSNTANRTITWTVNDGDADSTPKDTTITVTPTNDPPVLSDVAPTMAYTEGDGAKVIDADLTITDLDDTNIESATIVISAGYVNGQDVLTEGTLLNGVTASWSAATGTLTLTGPATKADYESMLEQITYSNSSDDPNTANRTITWTVNDGDDDSAPKDTTITVTPTNDRPVLSDVAPTMAYTEGDGAKVIDPDVTITDLDDTNIESATIVISAGYVNGQDVLTQGTLLNGVTASWSAATGTLTLTGPATKADYETMLEQITYSNSSDDPNTSNRTITWTVNDGDANSAQQNTTISVTPTNDPPVLSDVAPTMAYTEGDGAKVIDPALTITDLDDTNIESATIVISGGYVNGQDELTEGTLLNGVTASWSAATGTLTLTGPATKADYETMLEQITYTNSSGSANTGNRTITWTVNDGDANSAPQDTTITVSPTNDPPTTSGIADVSVDEDAPNEVIDLFTSFDDLEDADSGLTYTIEANSNAKLFSSVDISDPQNFTLDFAADAFGTADITIRATDSGGLWVEDTFTVKVDPVNDAPSSQNDTVTTDEDTPYTFRADDFEFNDVDPGDTLQEVKISELPSNGTLTLNGKEVTRGQVISIGDINSGDLQFHPANDDSGSPYDSFKFQVSDGTDYSAEATMTIDVNPVDDPSIVKNWNTSQPYNENTETAVVDIVITDIDSPEVTVTLTLSDPHAGSLSTVSTSSITPHFDNGVWKVTGPIGEVNRLLESLIYDPTDGYSADFRILVDISDGTSAMSGWIDMICLAQDTILTTATVGDSSDFSMNSGNVTVQMGPELVNPGPTIGETIQQPNFIHEAHPLSIGELSDGEDRTDGAGSRSQFSVGGPMTGQHDGWSKAFPESDLPENEGSRQDVTGLFGYTDNVASGKVLVFNIGDVNCMDLLSADITPQEGSRASVTGLPGFHENVANGKVLVFNIAEMSCLDLCTNPNKV